MYLSTVKPSTSNGLRCCEARKKTGNVSQITGKLSSVTFQADWSSKRRWSTRKRKSEAARAARYEPEEGRIFCWIQTRNDKRFPGKPMKYQTGVTYRSMIVIDG